MFLNVKVCNIKCKPGEDTVDSSLAITPAKMAELTAKGRAVSLASLENQSFYTNERDVYDMPIEYTRGIDVNELWEISRTASKRIKEFHQHKLNTSIAEEK